MKNCGLRSRKPRLTAVRIRCAGHATHSTANLALISPAIGGGSVGIFRFRTKSNGVCFVLHKNNLPHLRLENHNLYFVSFSKVTTLIIHQSENVLSTKAT
jgi:hypothetical protein